MKTKIKKRVSDMELEERQEFADKYAFRFFLTCLFGFLGAWGCIEAAFYGVAHDIDWLTQVAGYTLFFGTPIWIFLVVRYLCLFDKYAIGGGVNFGD